MEHARLGTQLGIVVSLVLFFFIVFFVLNFIPYIVDFLHWSFFFFFLSQLVLRAGVGAWVLFFPFGFFFFLDLLSVASYSWYTLYIGLMVIFYCRYSIFFFYYYFYTSSFWGPGTGEGGEGYDRYLVDNVIGGPGGGLLGFFFFFVASV